MTSKTLLEYCVIKLEESLTHGGSKYIDGTELCSEIKNSTKEYYTTRSFKLHLRIQSNRRGNQFRTYNNDVGNTSVCIRAVVNTVYLH